MRSELNPPRLLLFKSPCIVQAHDQPDVFETSDLPESEQHLEGVLHDDEVSDSVETLHLSAQEAMGRFKGKHLDSSGVDFSDRLRPSRQKKG